jgi:diguanylate cyclase (GGDEF)-like protein
MEFRMSIVSYLSATPVKMIRVAYILGLSLIGGMSVGAHLVVDRVVSQSEHSATTINLAGKQRMLSQRTAYFLVKSNETLAPADLQNLEITKDELAKNHDALIYGDKTLQISDDHPEAVDEIYYSSEFNLDEKFRNHLALADGFYRKLRNGQQISQSELAPFLKLSEGELLQLLDKVVKAHELEANQKIDNLLTIQRFAILAIIVAIFAEGLLIFNPLVRRIQRYSDNLEYAASYDQLTKILNRRAFYANAETEISRSQRHKRTMSVLLCDLDKFKSVNDVFGHAAGDKVLQSFAETIKSFVRKEDILARIGGEEFVILLPETDGKSAQIVADKICELTSSQQIEVNDDTKLTVTTSIGVTEISSDDMTIDDALVRADMALYKAKENGRNRFEYATPSAKQTKASENAVDEMIASASEVQLQPAAA